MEKVWFVTGAGRGLGAEIARAALRAGDRVVATARQSDTIGLSAPSDQLFCVDLDVTDPASASAAIDAATVKFGRIDVLVNNAGYGHLGFFEELDMADATAQLHTNLLGVFNVTWAALPVMRQARQGRIFNVSSLGGLMGGELSALYCASKFGLEGFSECLAKEVSPFGITVTIVEPGPFRTDFLNTSSLRFGDNEIPDYNARREALRQGFQSRDGQQPGDPAKLGDALVSLANVASPPLRFLAGAIAVNAARAKLSGMLTEFEHWKDLSLSTDGDFVQ